MRNKVIGNGGLFLAMLFAVAVSVAGFFVGHPDVLKGELGICFPSPNTWILPPVFSRILNILLILIIGIGLNLFNKAYNFINTTDPILPTAFILLCALNPWIDALLSSSVIMAGANLLCLIILFGCYESRNATREIFVVGTIIALGSMFQYAFVGLIIAYLLIFMTLRIFSFKSFIAFIMGLISPYWIGVGFGLIPIEAFSLPTFTNMFEDFAPRQALLAGVLNFGVTCLLTIIILFYNSVMLYAGNTRRRRFNTSIIILGLTCMVCVACDSQNMPVYMATIYMAFSVVLANLFALHRIRHPRTLLGFLLILYLVGWFFMDRLSQNIILIPNQ